MSLGTRDIPQGTAKTAKEPLSQAPTFHISDRIVPEVPGYTVTEGSHAGTPKTRLEGLGGDPELLVTMTAGFAYCTQLTSTDTVVRFWGDVSACWTQGNSSVRAMALPQEESDLSAFAKYLTWAPH